MASQPQTECSFKLGQDYIRLKKNRGIMLTWGPGIDKVLRYLHAGGVSTKFPDHIGFVNEVANRYFRELRSWDGVTPVTFDRVKLEKLNKTHPGDLHVPLGFYKPQPEPVLNHPHATITIVEK